MYIYKIVKYLNEFKIYTRFRIIFLYLHFMGYDILKLLRRIYKSTLAHFTDTGCVYIPGTCIY